MSLKFSKSQCLLLILILSLTSCISNKDIAYFQYDEIDTGNVKNTYVTVFKPDDLLQISVTDADIESVKPFNLPTVFFGNNSAGIVGQAQQVPYLVDNKGYIDFPVLGKIKVAGLTREALIADLKGRLQNGYLKSPTINIMITNFRINIVGDVRKPGSYRIVNERVTIMDAISMAGDLNISAKRHNVMVTREIDGTKKVYRLDLRSNDIYKSPAYYLQQNDNIYVEHNYARIQSASSNTNTSLFISITGLLITIVSLLTR